MLWRHQSLPLDACDGLTILPFGNGRSYGDVCLNTGGMLLDARPLDRFIRFNPEDGVLCCEAGVLLAEIIEYVVPKGWFLPVTPGTQYITVGGAIANDVHGKNHHRAGTFGCHVLRFELLHSDATRTVCSPSENEDWFRATVGGLGLTGLITWAEIQLKPINSPCITQQTTRFSSLDGFFELSDGSDADHEYTVAWVDCLARGRKLGRGIFFSGNHAEEVISKSPAPPAMKPSVPLVSPVSLVNHASLRIFNTLYYHKQGKSVKTSTVHFAPFFYPLDTIPGWNRMYGPGGFLQYQCVLPGTQGRDATREILERIACSGTGSFLSVLKVFGSRPSPGLMSFPRPGITLALDFPYQGSKTLALLEQLDAITGSVGGAVYPAKDARMSAGSFRRYFPQWKALVPFIDERFSSCFWRRVEGDDQ